MKLYPVNSSQINAIGYAAATNTMRIEFKSGSLYEYANVTPEVFEAFAKAPSIGSHFYKHIKPFADKYPYVKLEANKAMDAPAPEPNPDAPDAGYETTPVSETATLDTTTVSTDDEQPTGPTDETNEVAHHQD